MSWCLRISSSSRLCSAPARSQLSVPTCFGSAGGRAACIYLGIGTSSRYVSRPASASALSTSGGPMFRHVVLLSVNEGADVERIVRELNSLPSIIPELLSYSAGKDAGVSAGNANIAVVADFKSMADYEAYRDHAEHQRIIAQLIKPFSTGRTAVQYEIAEDKVQGGLQGTK